MYSIQDRFVEIADLITYKELNAFKVFEFSKKYGDKAIPLK